MNVVPGTRAPYSRLIKGIKDWPGGEIFHSLLFCDHYSLHSPTTNITVIMATKKVKFHIIIMILFYNFGYIFVGAPNEVPKFIFYFIQNLGTFGEIGRWPSYWRRWVCLCPGEERIC